MGDEIIDSLVDPIQCEDNSVRVNLCPKVYDLNNNNETLITFLDGNSIPVDYGGVLPCISVRKPTKYEVENYEQIALVSKFNCDPYGKVGSLYKVESHLNDIESVL